MYRLYADITKLAAEIGDAPAKGVRSGLKEGVVLRPHQEEAVKKLLKQDGNILLSHPVGSGKTVTAIAGFDALRREGKASRALIVTPASLRKNFTEEGVQQFTNDRVAVFGNAQEVAAGKARSLDNPDHKAAFHVVSYDIYRQNPEAYIKAAGADTVIYDELHKIKNEGGITGTALKDARKHHRNFIGLTGSIVSNTPADLVPLIDAMTDGKHGLGSKEHFENRFMNDKGELQNEHVMKIMIAPYVHHVDKGANDTAPKKKLEVVEVPMSKEQHELYMYVLKKMDPATALKFRMGATKLRDTEINGLFHKMTAARQASNAIHTVNKGVSLSESAERSPKIKKVLDDVENHLKETPDGQVIIYSNMIHGGVDVITQGLKDRGIDHGLFLGKGQPGSTETTRTQAVADYQSGKKRVIVLSSAGGEGLNLKNTTFVANVDGHFNPEKVLQAEARGIRSGGQAHRDPDKREVVVKRYVTTIPLSSTQVAMDTMNLISPSSILNRATAGQPILYNPVTPERSPDQWAYQVAGFKSKRNERLRANLDKAASAPVMYVDMYWEQELEKLAAVAKSNSPHKVFQKRLNEQKLPFQTDFYVKSDTPIMAAYMEDFGDELSELKDPRDPLTSKELQAHEQRYIDALRSYYNEAGKSNAGKMTLASKAKNDKERKAEMRKHLITSSAIGAATATLPMLPAITALAQQGRGSAAALATAVALGGGLTGAGLSAINSMRPVFTTSVAASKRMRQLSDDDLRLMLRGQEIEQREEMLRRLAVGSKARAVKV